MTQRNLVAKEQKHEEKLDRITGFFRHEDTKAQMDNK